MKRKYFVISSIIAVCLVMSLLLSGCSFIGGLLGGSSGSGSSEGKSAFEIFKEYHPEYEGTEEEWLESLKDWSSDGSNRGTIWFNGYEEPANVKGARNGDFYLRVFGDFSGKTGFAVYNMISGQWMLLADMSNELTEEELQAKTEYRVNCVEDLVAFRDSVNEGTSYLGKTVYLESNLDLSAIDNWAPIGSSERSFKGTFDGKGHVISNLTVNYPDKDNVGLFGYLGGDKGHITNLTIESATITGRAYCGVVLGNAFNFGKVTDVNVRIATVKGLKNIGGIAGAGYMNIENCAVDGLTAVATPANGDDGDKVGGIIGYMRDSNYSLTGCSVTNSNLTAYRDLGSLVGCYDGANILDKVTDNTVDNVTLTIDRTVDGGDSAENVRQVIGRTVGYADADEANESLAETNSIGTVTIDYVGLTDGDEDVNQAE